MIEKQKVLAYITQGSNLLVFNRVGAPEAGFQVPGGTVESNESLENAVLREAQEETNLSQFVLHSYLDQQIRDMRDFDIQETHHRHFFHLGYEEITPETWQHFELFPDNHIPVIYPFEFFWAKMPQGVPNLIAEHDYYIEKLFDKINIETGE